MATTSVTKKGSPVEIQSMLVLSTGHVTEETAKALAATDPTTGKLPNWGPHMVWEGLGYGWMWYADDATFEAADFPAEFEAIFKLAVALDCNWVRFDCDGDRVEELPYWEW